MTIVYNLSKLQSRRLKRPYKILVFTVLALIVVAVVAVVVYFATRDTSEAERIPSGAVVTNGYTCAKIGASILDKGGNAVDAAIAALFCEGVSMPQSMGLGGGFLMTIYIKENRTAVAVNARETAPAAADKDMFDGNSTSSTKGGLAVAVPGELRGYWEVYQRYGGQVPWKDLVQPTIDLCRNGIAVTKYLAGMYSSQIQQLKNDPGLSECFINASTGEPYREGEYVKRLKLAETLELIAKGGADVLYNGSLTESFVKDIQDNGGIITVEDMNNYTIEWQDPITIDMPSKQVLYTTPLPGSGVILAFVMNILNGFLDNSAPSSVTNWQRIVESFKYGYGKRTELGDMNYVDVADLVANLTSPTYAQGIRKQINDTTTSQDPEHYGGKTVQPEDHGTAHVSVLAPNGDAVSVTSTINLYFGAGFMSASTGIILNDEMDDFSSPNINNSFGIPPSEANFVFPGKRPLSSMCPSIIVGDDGEVELVIGAAGGTKITTSVAQITVKNLWFNVPIQEAVAEQRLHHQLYPMTLQLEDDFKDDMDFVDALHDIGHEYEFASATGFSAVTSISRKGGALKTATDKRRAGEQILVY